MPTQENFDSAFATFLEGCKRISAEYMATHFPRLAALDPSPWRVDDGQKRIRIVRDSGAHCFVDKETGDVLKAASWKAPAKHARGNIFDESNGLAKMGPYGPAYLR